MTCSRKIMVTSICTLLGLTLMGCGDNSYPTCDEDKIMQLTNTMQQEWQKCLPQHPGDALPSKTEFEKCMCGAYKPYITEMIKYEKPCKEAGKGSIVQPMQLKYIGQQWSTTCGVSLPTQAVARQVAAAESASELPAQAKFFKNAYLVDMGSNITGTKAQTAVVSSPIAKLSASVGVDVGQTSLPELDGAMDAKTQSINISSPDKKASASADLKFPVVV